jgi:hypothetical protein
MAHLWTEDGVSWVVVPLHEDLVILDLQGRRVADSSAADAPAVALVRARGEGGDHWVIVPTCGGRSALRVNGALLPADVRVAADRDEIAFGAASYFFSTETLPRVAPCACTEPVMCPRCKTAIAPRELSVECPGCRTRYHQHDEKPCWLYGPTCPLCGRQTALDQPYAWTPEVL